MNIFNPFRLNRKLAAEVATLNASNADLTNEKLTLEALLKQSRHYGDLQLALREKADRRRMAAESERDALLDTCDALILQQQSIRALATPGMSHQLAKAVVLAGGTDIRVKADRIKVLAVAARMKMQTAAVMVQF